MTDRLTYVPLRIGNRYTLERRLPDDDLAERWQATDTLLDRQVEVRVLRPERADEPNAVQRLRLEHQNGQRARLLDGGSDPTQGAPFAVFEWLEATPPQAARAEPRAPAKPPRAHQGLASRLGRHNLAVPVILTGLPLAAGVIIVAKVMSGQSIVQLPAPALVLPAPVAVASPPVAQAAEATPQRTAAPTPEGALATPSPSPASGERVRVANTDGIGVALRDGPGGNRLPGKGYDEGATVTVLQRQGAWAHIRGDDGREGWVLAVTVPAH